MSSYYTKPNLFVVGAAKSGTTTLYSYFKKHSRVFMPEDSLYKEPAFFSKKKQGMKIDDYMEIFEGVEDKHLYIGEVSTAYLTDEQSAKKIFDFNPNAKIIILLRNPVDRAYSLYNWMVQEGYEYASFFEKALKLEKKRKYKKIPNFFEPEYYWNYMYIESGLYYEQVFRYKKLFGNNVEIFIFEEMIENIRQAFIDICDFLNIEFEEYIIIKENESKKVIHPFVSFMTRKANKYYLEFVSLFKEIKTKKERDFLIRMVQLNKKPKKLRKNLRKKLMSYFLSDIERLEELLNKNLSIWKKL